ncbi:MAG: YunC family protein [Ignavibacteriales bacterium]
MERLVELVPLQIENKLCVGVSLRLPKTTVLAVVAPKGYLMCGLLDVERLDKLHSDRAIVAARVSGARTIEDLLAGRVDAVTVAGRAAGVTEGITGEEALGHML